VVGVVEMVRWWSWSKGSVHGALWIEGALNHVKGTSERKTNLGQVQGKPFSSIIIVMRLKEIVVRMDALESRLFRRGRAGVASLTNG
jgi:hypothetical protein